MYLPTDFIQANKQNLIMSYAKERYSKYPQYPKIREHFTLNSDRGCKTNKAIAGKARAEGLEEEGSRNEDEWDL